MQSRKARSRADAIHALAAGVLLTALIPGHARAEPTEITIRVIARNAMYVGDMVEGAQVTVADAMSGEVLAQGVTAGDAGDPERIMNTARKRGTPMALETDARFSATLDLAEPRYLQVTAFGPLGQRDGATRTSMTQWVVPGRHLTGGDGWVIELAGFVVRGDVARTSVSLAEARRGIAVEAEISPMCGCPVKPDFYWDAGQYEVAALVTRGETNVGRYPLRYAGTVSEFTGTVSFELPGLYDVTVYAYDPSSGNTGVDRLELTVGE